MIKIWIKILKKWLKSYLDVNFLHDAVQHHRKARRISLVNDGDSILKAAVNDYNQIKLWIKCEFKFKLKVNLSINDCNHLGVSSNKVAMIEGEQEQREQSSEI